MAKKLIKKPVLKKAQDGLTEAPTKSKERWNASAQYYEPTRRNQIIDSTFTPQGINKAKLKEHAATIKKMSADKEYLSREKALSAPMTGTPTPWKNGGKAKMKTGGKVVAKKVTKVAIKKKK
jgi:hypothetical protein